MENFLFIFTKCINKTTKLKIKYKDIKPSIPYSSKDYINVKITNKLSLFNIKPDIFIYYKDKFIFSEEELIEYTESDDHKEVININESINIIEYIKELEIYLKYYIERNIKKDNQFIFMHKINMHKRGMKKLQIQPCLLNSSKDNRNKWEDNSTIYTIIDTSSKYNNPIGDDIQETRKLILFYKKYNINTEDQKLNIYKGDKKMLLNDILQIRIPDKTYFYFKILNILPVDLSLILIRNMCLSKEKAIFLYYKLFKLYEAEYKRLSFMFLYRMINELRNSINVEIIDCFKDKINIFGEGWMKKIYNVDEYFQNREVKHYGSNISNVLIREDKCISIELSSGDIIWRYDDNSLNMPSKENVINLNGKEENPDNTKYEDDTRIELFNKRMTTSYIHNRLNVKSNTDDLFVNTIQVKINDELIDIPVYRNIKKEDTVLFNPSKFKHMDRLLFKRVVLSDRNIDINSEFIFIEEKYKVDLHRYTDIEYKIYEFTSGNVIIEGKFYIQSKWKGNHFIYKMNEGFYREIYMKDINVK